MKHSDFMDELLLQVSKRQLSVKLYKRHVGKFMSVGQRRVVSIGVKGQCDLYGYVIFKKKPAQAIEIEIKASKSDKLRPEQIVWRDLCLKRNVHWYESRDIEITIDWIKKVVASQSD